MIINLKTLVNPFQFVDSEVLTVESLFTSSFDSLDLRFKNGFYIIQIMEKKIAKKYADLIVQANNSTGRKEALSLIKQATKLKTKLDQYEMM